MGSLGFLGRISVHVLRDVQRLNKATEGSQPVDASFMTAASPGVVALFQVSINQFFWLQLNESTSLISICPSRSPLKQSLGGCLKYFFLLKA